MKILAKIITCVLVKEKIISRDDIEANIKKWKNVQNLIIKSSFQHEASIYSRLQKSYLELLENERMLYAEQHAILNLLEEVR